MVLEEAAASAIGKFFMKAPRLHRLKEGFAFAAGATGGLVASIATCPLDVIKTKLQAQSAIVGQPAYQGVFGECFIRYAVRRILNPQ